MGWEAPVTFLPVEKKGLPLVANLRVGTEY